MNHTAATMVGMQVTASVELAEVDGRKLRFNVIAHDEAGPIGQGTHDRFIIDIATFMDRAAQRAG